MSKEKPYTFYNFTSTNCQQKTIIVLGCARGGTSMVAGTLRELGVMLGDRFDGVTHEDIEFRTANIQELKSIIRNRNERYDVWGWKYPHSINYIDKIMNDLRNPHFIAVFRNLISIANSFSRYNVNSEFSENLIQIQETYTKIIKFLLKTKAPTMYINYEKSLSLPENFINGLSDFIEINSCVELHTRASSFINKDGYRPLTTDKKIKIEFSKINNFEKNWCEIKDLKITPINLQTEGKNTVGINNDPQYTIDRDNKKFHSDLIIEFYFESHQTDQFKVYFDFGNGFTELSAILLEEASCGHNIFQLKLPEQCFQIRIDPIESNDKFILKNIRFYTLN